MFKKTFFTFLLLFVIFSFPLYANLKCGGILKNNIKSEIVFISNIKDGPDIYFDSSVNPFYYNYFTNLLNTVYPYIIHFYGNCPYNTPLTIKYDSQQVDWFFYDKSSNTIVISTYPTSNYNVDNDGDGRVDEDPFNGVDDDGDGKIDEDYNNDPSYDAQFIHEFIHSFHRDIDISEPWIEEGMTEACTELIGDYLYREKIRDMRGRDPQKNIFLFDLLEENNFLSPSINFFNSAIPEYYYDYSAAIFLILSSGYSDSGDIFNFTLLKIINENLRNVDCSPIDNKTFCDILNSITYGKYIDGFQSGDFLRNLSINREKKECETLVLLPIWTKFNDKWYFSTVNPMNITYFILKRYIDDNGVERETFVVSEKPLRISVFKGDTLILQNDYELFPYPKNDWLFDSSLLSDGVYQLEGKITLDNGITLTKKIHFLISHSENIPSLINTLEAGFGIILLNRSGNTLGNIINLSNNQSFTEISSFESGGTYKFLSDEINHFDFNLDSHQLSITIPLPFTRVAIKKISFFTIPLNLSNENSYTGITIVNRCDFPIDVTLTLSDGEGNKVLPDKDSEFENPKEFEISEKGENIFIVKDIFPVDIDENYSLEIFSASPVEAFFMKGDYGGSFLDGSIPSETLSKEITIPVLMANPYSTKIFLKNPHSSDTLFTFFLFDSDGNILDFSDTMELAPKSEKVFNLSEIFQNFNEESYIKIRSSLSLLSYTFFLSENNLALLPKENEEYFPNIIIPHIAMGGGYYTKIHLLSLESSKDTSISISIFDSNGNVILDSYQLSLLTPGKKINFDLQQIIGNSSKDYFDGWLKMETDGNILAYAEIGGINGNFLTIQPAYKKLSTNLLFNHIATGNLGDISYFTGISIVNPYPFENSFKIFIYDGTNPEPIYSSEYSLTPFSRFISLIGNDNLFPDCGDMGRGYIDIISDYPVGAYEIFGDNSLNFISSVAPYF